MPEFSLETFTRALRVCAPGHSAWCIGLSGGLDSMVLLQAMAALRVRQPQWSLRALHVDHQLQPRSAEWAEACVAAARTLDVPCEVLRVRVEDLHGEGPEAAARRARYAAFTAVLQNGEVLLTAHHADDQLETLLLALLRGSGVPGLAGMPACTPFAVGLHARPLLAFTRDDLQAWATAEGIGYVDDPSNRDTRFDRNFLRHEVIPLLKSRWPAAAHSISRSAQHLAEADGLLDEMAEADLRLCSMGDCLVVGRVRGLAPARRRLLWRHWIRRRGLPLPSTRTLQALDHDMFNAAVDRNPCVRWEGAEVRRHGELLYALSGAGVSYVQDINWPWREPLLLPASLGVLGLDSTLPSAPRPALAAARLPEALTVRFRSGGERIRLPNAGHRSELKKLMQEAGILPWWRSRLPLIYAGEALIAVADMWISDEFAARGEDERPLWICWRGRPQLTSLRHVNENHS